MDRRMKGEVKEMESPASWNVARQKPRTMDHSKLTAQHLCLQGPNTALSRILCLPNQI